MPRCRRTNGTSLRAGRLVTTVCKAVKDAVAPCSGRQVPAIDNRPSIGPMLASGWFRSPCGWPPLPLA